MARKPKPKPDDKEQSQRFVDTARELEVDETGEAFNDAFSKATSHPSLHGDSSKDRKKK